MLLTWYRSLRMLYREDGSMFFFKKIETFLESLWRNVFFVLEDVSRSNSNGSIVVYKMFRFKFESEHSSSDEVKRQLFFENNCLIDNYCLKRIV